MKNMFRNLWNDDAGFIVSGEIVFLFTITVIGLIVGWVHVRNAVTAELTDIGNSISALNQSYSFDGIATTCANTNQVTGSGLIDNAGPSALNVTTPAAPNPVTSSIEACLP